MPETTDDILKEFFTSSDLVTALLAEIDDRVTAFEKQNLTRSGVLDAVRQSFEDNGAKIALKNLAAHIEYLAKEAQQES